MKRNLLLLAVMVVATLFFNSQSWAQFPCWPGDSSDCCGADSCVATVIPAGHSLDLGTCDTLYVETHPCDHTYDTTGVCDSVRVCIYVTHDSNTFFAWSGTGSERWAQDSIAAFTVPLTFWHQPAGHADSVVLPTYGNWNNTIDYPIPKLNRSVFRDIICGTDTIYNRLLSLEGKWETKTLNIESHSCDGDSGHAWFGLIAGGGGQKWWEGSHVLLATLTFLVYMNPAYDTTEIGIDSMFWEQATGRLLFVRYDARGYIPRHLLPVKDTIYVPRGDDVKWIDGSTEENKPTTFNLSQNYPNPFNPVTNFKFSLPQASHVKIEVFNILGQNVNTLVDEDMKAGSFVVDWNGKDQRGVEVTSGIYFYRMTAGDFSSVKRMVLLK